MSSDETAEIKPLGKSESVYERDENGDLIAQERIIETSEGPRRVRIYPTPKGESMKYRERYAGRDELDVDELDDILNEKIAEPDLDWSNPDIKPGVYGPVLDAVIEDIRGEAPSNEFHEQVQAELDKRDGSGN